MSYRLGLLQSIAGQYYSAHLRFFRQLCTAAKVDEVSKLARKMLDEGKCVVVGLQSTGKFCLRTHLRQTTCKHALNHCSVDQSCHLSASLSTCLSKSCLTTSLSVCLSPCSMINWSACTCVHVCSPCCCIQCKCLAICLQPMLQCCTQPSHPQFLMVLAMCTRAYLLQRLG